MTLAARRLRAAAAGRALAVAALFAAGLPAAASVERAIAEYERGEYRGASELLAEASRATPSDGRLRLWLGKTFLKLRRWDDAVRELEAAASIQPASSLYHLWLGRAYGEKASHGSRLAGFGLARKVRQEFETAVRLDPDNLPARFDLLEFYLEAPWLVGGGRDKAEAQATEIATRNRMAGHLAAARLQVEDKNWAKARAAYNEACAAAPQQAEPFARLAEYLLDRSEFAEARTAAERAVALQPANRQAKMLLAAARIELRADLAEAEKTLRGLVAGPLGDDDPSFAEAHYWLGRSLQALSMSAQAGDAFRKALQFDPDYERAKQALAALR